MCNKIKKVQMKRDNIDYPRGITEHSFPVSDINAMDKDESINTDLTEDIRSHALPHSRQEYGDELAYQIGDRYFVIQMSEDGYDYTFYSAELEVIDGGNYDDPDISIREAADILLKEEGVGENQKLLVAYDALMEKVEQAGQKIIKGAREWGKQLIAISDHTAARSSPEWYESLRD